MKILKQYMYKISMPWSQEKVAFLNVIDTYVSIRKCSRRFDHCNTAPSNLSEDYKIIYFEALVLISLAVGFKQLWYKVY